MRNIVYWSLLVFFVVSVAACAMNGPVSAPVAAGVAGLIAAYDQLLAAGTITPEQHSMIVGSVSSIQATMEALKHAQDSQWSPEATAGAAGGATATVLALLETIKKLRGKSRSASAPKAA